MGEKNDVTRVVGAGLAIPGKIRRVVLAETNGSSFVAREERLEGSPFPGIGQLFTLWATDSVVELRDSGTIPAFDGAFPPVGGFRVYLTRFSPSAARSDRGGTMPHQDMPSASDPHSSDTVDVNVLLSGTLDCLLSDGSVVSLKAGDVIVLNGAAHSWENTSTEEAVMLFFMTGAKRT